MFQKESRSDKSQVVAILGLSNLDYIVNILALTRMGFAILFLSTRLPIEAYISLLENTKCSDILVSKRYKRTIQQISELYPIHSFNLLEQSFYLNQTVLGPRFQRETDLINEENCVAFIIHSSGSTGLPKAISQKHRACLFNYAAGGGMRAFVTLPLFHNHGLSTLFRGIVAGKRTVLYNANLPLTMSSLVQAMQIAKPESFHGVPYALKVLAEAQQGIDELRKCDLVLFGGSSCPDELGDKLVNNGVYLVTHYGA
jgi:acyl-CoA synthetase (AMP-forming)/AMP-acid ligase II